ncbi:MAG: DUF305 domain-containing protein [Actinobacteria bacterium]|nr:DUF305 domain-containing protein [Actinomycetota bacterium]MBU1609965.1 DUF305 domain-containing protein [Actinomycetota bacterium]MBU2315667.1 DUF305 domain-containing protein [Actinomycetota bacterium]MBU2385521.1 DUF305 domain-containing protein [Actinomycetota bacterium]
MKKRIAIIAGVIVLVGLSAAGALAWMNRAEPFNDRDVSFASNMVPHHVGALEMAEVILAKEGIPVEVQDLAARIEAAQQPEINQMNDWLRAWGAPTVAGGHGGHSMMMSGMMSEADMMALEDAQGIEAARLFLEGMIVHHKGAVEMAQVEVDGGKFPEAVALARAIIEQQTDEIAEMEILLANL